MKDKPDIDWQLQGCPSCGSKKYKIGTEMEEVEVEPDGES